MGQHNNAGTSASGFDPFGRPFRPGFGAPFPPIWARLRDSGFAQIFEQARNEIYIFDAHSLRFLNVNRAARDNLGYSLDELRQLTPLDIKPDLSAAKCHERLAPLVNGQCEKVEFETVHRRKDGSLYPIEVHLQLANFDGQIVFVAFAIDITERQRVEATLKESQERLELAVLGSNEGLWDWNIETGEMFYSPRLKTLLGFEPHEGEFTYAEWESRIHPDDRERVHAALRQHLQSRQPFDVEYRMRTKQETYRWYHDCGHALWNDHGEPMRMAGSISDITERRETQEQLATANRHMAAVLDAASEVSIIATDPQGLITLFNRGAEKLLGYSAMEMIGRQTPVLIHLESEVVERARELSALLGRPVHGFQAFVALPERDGAEEREWTYVRQDGEHRTVLLAVTCLRDSQQRITGYLGVAIDISGRKRAEKELEKLALVAAKTDNAVVVTNRAGLTEWVNEGFTRFTGYTLDEMRGRSPGAVLQGPDTDPQHVASLREAIRNQRSYEGEIYNYRKDGKGYWNGLSITPIQSNSGEATGFIAIAKDITTQKESAAELQRAKEAAEAANRSKSEFLANMSHELRTPLTAILGFSDVLLGHLDAAEDRDCLGTIKRNGEHLLELINDILDLSKIEAGKLEIEAIPCCPQRLVQEVVRLMDVRAKGAGLYLNVETEGAIPALVRTDPTRLRQILINLIGNAIKFTAVGGIRVVLRVVTRESQPQLQIDVVDTGIGMSESVVARLFRPFVQADASTTRRYGGTGLGLSISQRLATMLGGNVSVRSQPGRGSVFTVTIATGGLAAGPSVGAGPNAALAAVPETVRPVADIALAGVQVLLVEDGPDNQRLISHFLKKAGAEVEVVDNGAGAFELIQARATLDRPYDIVFMDMQMPIMDGYEATRRLRAAGHTLPIIGVTAHAMSGDREKCLAAGCDDYAVKPIDRRRLLELAQAYGRDR